MNTTPFSQHPFRVIVRNLHYTTPTSAISQSFDRPRSYSKQKSIKYSKQNVALPLFFVDLKLAENKINIFNNSSLFNTRINIENPYKVKSGSCSMPQLPGIWPSSTFLWSPSTLCQMWRKSPQF